MRYRFFIIFFLFIKTVLAVEKYSYDCKGEISLQGGGYSLLEAANYYGGLRIIPFFQGQADFSDGSYLESGMSVNEFFSYRNKLQNKLELYRAYISYQTFQTEIKVGLQKITFGPAKFLRPLMWFDRINPTDPMQITRGVYGALFRYYTLNNTNFWLWGLYGNDGLKGLEYMKTDPHKPEFGGRLQIPIKVGEMAMTYHNRKLQNMSDREQRLALDGHYDLGIGIWFEWVTSLINGEVDNKMLSIGGDYTFGLGNGLNVIAEFMPVERSTNLWITDPDEKLYALSFSYPLNILDQLMYLTYYAESMDKLFHYIRYQRTYDKLLINISLFHFPEIGYDVFTGRKSDISGFGAQLMLIYNF